MTKSIIINKTIIIDKILIASIVRWVNINDINRIAMRS